MAGIAFMVTNVMKDALRSRGLTATEIEQIQGWLNCCGKISQ